MIDLHIFSLKCRKECAISVKNTDFPNSGSWEIEKGLGQRPYIAFLVEHFFLYFTRVFSKYYLHQSGFTDMIFNWKWMLRVKETACCG